MVETANDPAARLRLLGDLRDPTAQLHHAGRRLRLQDLLAGRRIVADRVQGLPDLMDHLRNQRP